MSLLTSKLMKIQKASSSSSMTAIRVLAMKFIPQQQPTSGIAQAMASRTLFISYYPSSVFILSAVNVLFKSLEMSSFTLSFNLTRKMSVHFSSSFKLVWMYWQRLFTSMGTFSSSLTYCCTWKKGQNQTQNFTLRLQSKFPYRTTFFTSFSSFSVSQNSLLIIPNFKASLTVKKPSTL